MREYLIRMDQIEIDWQEDAGSYFKLNEALIKNEILKRVSKLKEIPHLLSVLNAEFESEVQVCIYLPFDDFIELRCYLEGEKGVRMLLYDSDGHVAYVRIKGVKGETLAEIRRHEWEGKRLILELLGGNPDNAPELGSP